MSPLISFAQTLNHLYTPCTYFFKRSKRINLRSIFKVVNKTLYLLSKCMLLLFETILLRSCFKAISHHMRRSEFIYFQSLGTFGTKGIITGSNVINNALDSGVIYMCKRERESNFIKG